ncbi:MAG: hypothetical protein M3Y64_06105 [Gemmatimonadota bacterium]|nr:hypothetical protein [Gemmatimonadota bacterium]
MTVSSSAMRHGNAKPSRVKARINGRDIAPLMPATGPVSVLIAGEAPGPRGADKSGIPFFGDAAGRHLYRALRTVGAVQLPDAVDAIAWNGVALLAAGFAPVAVNSALTNAFSRCPTDDGMHFRAPTRIELEGEQNSMRLVAEIAACKARDLHGIVTLGKVAARTMQHVIDKYFGGAIALHAVPHPSAQGLLSMAPDRGRGARMADLQDQWREQCILAIRNAGFVAPIANTSPANSARN